jgi:hypothetical protein
VTLPSSGFGEDDIITGVLEAGTGPAGVLRIGVACCRYAKLTGKHVTRARLLYDGYRNRQSLHGERGRMQVGGWGSRLQREQEA